MMRREVALRSPMTAEEVGLVNALAKCRLPPGSADRRFCVDLSEAVKVEGSFSLTEGQRAYLWRLGDRYSLLLPPEILALLQTRPAPGS